MNANDKIARYFASELSDAKQQLKTSTSANSFFLELLDKLELFDFQTFKQNIRNNIEHSLTNFWTNPAQGIDPKETISAILFEYNSPLDKEPYAHAYGIIDWEDFGEYTEMFDMGDDYDFAEGFEATLGFDLDFFSPLAVLTDWYDENTDEYAPYLQNMEGYQALINAYLFSGLLCLHEVFKSMTEQGYFSKLNTAERFIFIIGEHDSEQYPLLILTSEN